MKTARFREVRKYLRAPVTREVVERAAKAQGLRISESSESFLRLRAPFNIWSYGEVVDVMLDSVDGLTLVDITSTCIFKLQIADWGRNERNTKRLLIEIDHLLGDACESETCPLCRQCGYLLAGISATTCPECGASFTLADKPASQDVATVRNVFALVVVITAMEVGLGFLLHLLDVDRKIPGLPHGVNGALFLLKVNFFALFSVIAMHRLVKYLRRR